MIYINDQNKQFVTYDEAVDVVIESGIKPKTAYLYLASLGVKGMLARIANPDTLDYYPAQKIAVKNNQTIVSSIEICKHCKGLIVK